MHPMIAVGSRALVLAIAIYLLVLGFGALVRPETAKRFLGSHASTLPLHLTELALRVLAGSAFVLSAPRTAVSTVFLVFGWVLIGTSLLLALLPWRLHQRFAAWSVPRATQHMRLIGVASIVGGIGVIAALFLQPAAG
jgi:uncharacterized protein YjeT (DUF2065 family)